MFSFSFSGFKKMFTRNRGKSIAPTQEHFENLIKPEPKPVIHSDKSIRLGCNNSKRKKDARKRASRSRRINRLHAKYSH